MTPEIWTASEIAAALKLSRRHVAERIWKFGGDKVWVILLIAVNLGNAILFFL